MRHGAIPVNLLHMPRQRNQNTIGPCPSLSFNNNNQIVGDTYDADGNLLYDGANTLPTMRRSESRRW
ncbi:MAG: hypothetical protein ACRD2O_10845 [Terriglobia bacterium]